MKSLQVFIFITWYILSATCTSFDQWGPVILPFRQNDILFVVSEACSEADFNNLLNLWVELDTEPLAFDYQVVNLYLSDKFNDSYSNSSYPMDYEDFFNQSLTQNVREVTKRFIQEVGIQKSCPPSGTTIQTIIFSDTCLLTELATINQQPTYECPFDYQNYVLYMPTDADVIACQNSYGEVKDKLHIFRADNLTDHDFHTIQKLYNSSLSVYYCNFYSTTFNAFSVVNDPYYNSIIFDYLLDKFTNTKECNHGAFAGYFQYISKDSEQLLDLRILPIDRCGTVGSLEWNLKNFYYVMPYPNDNNTNCDDIINNLNKILNSEFDAVQYNVLFLDAYPSCIKNLKWTKKNRHLDIYVFGQEEHASTYLSFIDGSSTLSNHVTFITKDNARDILALDTVCKSSVPSVTFNETTVIEDTGLSTTATTFTTDITNTDTSSDLMPTALSTSINDHTTPNTTFITDVSVATIITDHISTTYTSSTKELNLAQIITLIIFCRIYL